MRIVMKYLGKCMKYNKNNEMNHGILYKFVETTKIYTFNEIRTRTKIS